MQYRRMIIFLNIPLICFYSPSWLYIPWINCTFDLWESLSCNFGELNCILNVSAIRFSIRSQYKKKSCGMASHVYWLRSLQNMYISCMVWFVIYVRSNFMQLKFPSCINNKTNQIKSFILSYIHKPHQLSITVHQWSINKTRPIFKL